MTRTNNGVAAHEDNLVLQARDVHFDWSALPMHWVPREPFVTHTLNVLHLLLPEGERWFVEVFKQALPLIKDDKLRADVLGFIGQEAQHAEAHSGVLDHFAAHGLDPARYTDQVRYLFRTLLGDRRYLHGAAKKGWLVERLALIAAIEHYTAVLGEWVLDTPELDAAGADPTMLDLLRWHGAEEVEHRSVAYDLFQHVDGRYGRRIRTMLVVTPVLFWLWVRGVRFLMAADPVPAGGRKPAWQDWFDASRRGLLPSRSTLARSIAPYFRPGFHPSREGSTDAAVAYLAASPAARAAH